jgi:hypothetical protein
VRLAELAGARSVLLFHHDPSRTDEEVDAIVAGFADAPVPVDAAAESTTHDLALRSRTQAGQTTPDRR